MPSSSYLWYSITIFRRNNYFSINQLLQGAAPVTSIRTYREIDMIFMEQNDIFLFHFFLIYFSFLFFLNFFPLWIYELCGLHEYRNMEYKNHCECVLRRHTKVKRKITPTRNVQWNWFSFPFWIWLSRHTLARCKQHKVQHTAVRCHVNCHLTHCSHFVHNSCIQMGKLMCEKGNLNSKLIPHFFYNYSELW